MVRLNTVTVSLPRIRDHKNSISTITVIVLTPPAVEPEEPPMNISTMVTPFPPSVSPAWSKEAKPAVRVVTDWKKALSIFSPKDMDPKVWGLFHSSKAKASIPPTNSVTVASSTSLVYTLNRLNERTRIHSSQTRKPRPPITTKPPRVRSTTGSLWNTARLLPG